VTAAGLAVDLALRVGDFDLDVSFRAEPGATVAILGPNGAGKTTLLRCLAGLQRIDRGRIEVDGAVWDSPDDGVFVDAAARGAGVVFQEHLLFPSMSVVDNVGFGLRARGMSRAVARARATALLDAVGLVERTRDRPDALSGGQRQRVALARALAVEPSLLLLDEPLAALDVTTRAEIRRELRRHLGALASGVRLLVTHDPVDAFALAERVVVLEDGRVTHDGPLAEIAARPRTGYVADLIGVNLYSAVAGSGTPGPGGTGSTRGRVAVEPDGVELVSGSDVGGPVFAVVHPRAVSLHRQRPSGSPRNVWAAVVADVDLERDRARVRLDGRVPITAEITAASAVDLSLRPGDDVWVSIKATEVEVYPR
jgi:molybdate transport system ATP-binding protein